VNLNPPQCNILLVQRLGEFVPLDQIDVAVRSGIDDAIRDGSEGERLEEYRSLEDFREGVVARLPSPCSKLGFQCRQRSSLLG
jgi:hypothetical protein